MALQLGRIELSKTPDFGRYEHADIMGGFIQSEFEMVKRVIKQLDKRIIALEKRLAKLEK